MIQRIGVAIVAIPLAIAAAWYGGPVLAVLLLLLAGLGAGEIVRLARQDGITPWRYGAVGSAAVLPVLAWGVATGRNDLASWPYAVVVWFLVILLHALWRRGPKKKPLSSAAVTLLATLYAGGLLSFAMIIRHATGYGERSIPGALLLLFPIVTTWVCDAAAMEFGRRLKGPKLAPTISPGKTWSGSVAGLLAALIAAPAIQVLVLARWDVPVSPFQALIVGAVVGIAGQLGDLTESLFKREAGVKDSSHILPGHGGILDRLDSLYFVIPLSAILYRYFGIL
jgi:phosphatidate cytidylyltransferase